MGVRAEGAVRANGALSVRRRLWTHALKALEMPPRFGRLQGPLVVCTARVCVFVCVCCKHRLTRGERTHTSSHTHARTGIGKSITCCIVRKPLYG